MKENMTFDLLTVVGKVKPASVEATCKLHNETAGHPEAVAAARALGDMSHMTFMPLQSPTAFSGELLFMDIWNNIDGLDKFFSDPQVQGGAQLMFSTREAVVWNKLHDFLNFHFPTPTGKNGRIVGMIRGTVKSIDEAKAIHNQAMESQVDASRMAGIISHEFYVRSNATGSPEVLGVDVWMDTDRMIKHYESPGFQNSGLYKVFNAKPASSVWVHPAGDWVEW